MSRYTRMSSAVGAGAVAGVVLLLASCGGTSEDRVSAAGSAASSVPLVPEPITGFVTEDGCIQMSIETLPPHSSGGPPLGGVSPPTPSFEGGKEKVQTLDDGSGESTIEPGDVPWALAAVSDEPSLAAVVGSAPPDRILPWLGEDGVTALGVLLHYDFPEPTDLPSEFGQFVLAEPGEVDEHSEHMVGPDGLPEIAPTTNASVFLNARSAIVYVLENTEDVYTLVPISLPLEGALC